MRNQIKIKVKTIKQIGNLKTKN